MRDEVFQTASGGISKGQSHSLFHWSFEVVLVIFVAIVLVGLLSQFVKGDVTFSQLLINLARLVGLASMLIVIFNLN